MTNTKLDDLISTEIVAAVKHLRAEAAKKRLKAAQLLEEADENEVKATRFQSCDANHKHEFRDVPGSGMLGDRFEEKCIRCGWIHTF